MKEELETEVLHAFQHPARWTITKMNDKGILVWEGKAGDWVVVVCVLRMDIANITVTASKPKQDVLFVMSEKAAKVLWDTKRRSAS